MPPPAQTNNWFASTPQKRRGAASPGRKGSPSKLWATYDQDGHVSTSKLQLATIERPRPRPENVLNENKRLQKDLRRLLPESKVYGDMLLDARYREESINAFLHKPSFEDIVRREAKPVRLTPAQAAAKFRSGFAARAREAQAEFTAIESATDGEPEGEAVAEPELGAQGGGGTEAVYRFDVPDPACVLLDLFGGGRRVGAGLALLTEGGRCRLQGVLAESLAEVRASLTRSR